jgi:hypothetical protein
VSTEDYLRRKKALTIIAGFKCREGIILCADTQETIGVSKRSIPKLVFEPAGRPHEGPALAVAFCGAGENGAFIDNLVESAWDDGKHGTTIDEVCEKIKKNIKSTYKDFGSIYQRGYCPTANLIYGVKMQNECRLFSASGPIVNKIREYDSFGVGQYMADFLAGRMYDNHLNLRQCAILAAYILFQAKEHVDGCGGESHIAVLRENGVSGLANRRNIEAWTELLRLSDRELGNVLIDAGDVGVESTEFLKRHRDLIALIDSLRTNKAAELYRGTKIHAAFIGSKTEDLDFFGLPLPSSS